GSLIAFQKPHEAPAAAADRLVLRDGSVVLGVVASVSSGPRGAVDLLVRRGWAESHLKVWAGKWDRSIENAARIAARERNERLTSWRRGRATAAKGDDRILTWIEQELKRIHDPLQVAHTPLMPVHLSRSDIRSMARQPLASTRLLQLGWLCGLKDVESMPLDE